MRIAIRVAWVAAQVCFSAAVLIVAPSAFAAAQRTFVGPTGNDANACSLASPCRTFAAAIAQTLSGGEVIVLDSAGYGPVAIAQSVSIIAPPGIYAGISALSGTAIYVNGAGINVVLRGLNIVGLGGNTGVDMASAASLTIDGCVISNMATYGIYAQTSSGKLMVSKSDLRGNNIGIYVNGGVTVTVEQSRIVQSIADGVQIDGGATLQVAVADVSLNGNIGVEILASSGGVTTRAAIANSRFGDNLSRGVRATSNQGVVYLTLSDTLITANGFTGLSLVANGIGSEVHLVAQRVQSTNNAGTGVAVNATTGATADASVSDSSFAYNVSAGFAAQSSTGGKVRGALSASQAIGNLNGGIVANASDAGSSTELAMTNSSVTANVLDGVSVFSDGAGNTVFGSFTNSQITANTLDGIRSQNSGATTITIGNTIARNGGAGLHVDGGVILSAGNNATQGNIGGDVSGVLGAVAVH